MFETFDRIFFEKLSTDEYTETLFFLYDTIMTDLFYFFEK